MPADAIRENTLRELVAASSVTSAVARGQHGGFVLSVRCGGLDRLLGSTRGNVRVFSNLTSLAVFLRGIGVSQFSVDSAQYEQGRVRAPRPDRADALRRTRSKPRQTELLN